MFSIPEEIQNNVDLLVASQKFACGANPTLVKCWGSNEYGQTNIPTDLHGTV